MRTSCDNKHAPREVQSGRAQPHSKTWRKFADVGDSDRSWSAAVLCRFLCLALLFGFSVKTGAQRVVEGKSLKFPEYYEAPHQNQLKSLLEGARVQPQTNDIFFVTEAKLQTYREDGAPEMIVT